MILLDTSGLLCYVYRDQPGHEEAVQLLDSAGKSITHSYVLAELVALAQVRRYPRLATLEFITDLLENPEYRDSLDRRAFTSCCGQTIDGTAR